LGFSAQVHGLSRHLSKPVDLNGWHRIHFMFYEVCHRESPLICQAKADEETVPVSSLPLPKNLEKNFDRVAKHLASTICCVAML